MRNVKKNGCERRARVSIFFLCFFQILLYTLGVIIACGLAVELCYQLCFSLMGRRATRVFWLVTGWLGTPIHELGHAITCLLFCHRIEYVRLWPTRQGNAMVEHSYNRRNPYAVFGNVWIALGPILAGLAVMVGILALVYPSTLELLWQSLSSPSQPNAVGSDLLARVGRLIKGICFEQTLPIGWRIVALCAMLSMALHVRLSVADIKGMLRGVPLYACLSAIVAAVVAMLGESVHHATVEILRRLAWAIALLFSLIMIFALALLAILIVWRILLSVLSFFFGNRR